MSWLETLLRKRTAQVSTVAVIDSDDRFRLKELFITLLEKYSAVYYWDVRGLCMVRSDCEKGYTLHNTNEPSLLEHALSRIDALVKENKTPTAFIIFPSENYPLLNAYIKAWALDDRMYDPEIDFLCCIFGGKHLVNESSLRLSILIEPPPSTEEERKNLLEKLHFPHEDGVITAGAGLNLHEFETTVLESVALYGIAKTEFVAKTKAEIVKKEGVLEIEEPKQGFEAIGGYEYLKNFVKDNIVNVLTRPEKATRLGLRLPRGLLLFGPPGTGKTVFARALAKELKIPFLRFKTEHVVSKWYGETERNVARAIKIAESVAPCIVFVDEIDRFGRRGRDEHEVTKRTFSILLEWLGSEERKAIILGTTNVPEQLDEAFLRVGRFDYHIPVLYPDRNARLEILKVHTNVKRQVPLEDETVLEEVADVTELFTGAELEELVLRAARNAFRRDSETVSWDDFQKAIHSFSIDEKTRKEQYTRYIELAKTLCNDKDILAKIC
jgi:ATP-dependent 26S proteasome regulatory subunit